MEKRRVLSLLRVSGDAQIDRTGLPRQTDAIKSICSEHNLIVQEGDEYRFEGLSGASVDKFPKFNEMLQRLSDPKIAGIVFSDVSRLFRPEFVDQLGISKPFRVNGKLMYYEDGVLDLRNDRDMKVFIDDAMEAGAYRKRLLKNTKWGREERRRYGNCKSDPLPQGVVFVEHPKIKNELPIGHFEYTHDFFSDRVIEAFKRVLAGQSLSKIAKDLNFGKPGKPNPNVLRYVLRSRWWIGEKASMSQRENYGLRDDGKMYHGKRTKRKEPIIVPAKFDCLNCPTLHRDVHEAPLIPREDFFEVQRILDSLQKTWTRKESDDSPYLGQGVLYCVCGRKIYTKPNRLRGKVVNYYRCSSYNNHNLPCGAPHFHQDAIDQKLRQHFRQFLNPSFVKLLRPEKTASLNQEFIQQQIAALERVKLKQYAKIGHVEDDELLDRMIRETESQLAALRKQLTAKPTEPAFDPRKEFRRLQGFDFLSLAEQKKVLRGVFRRIIIDHKGVVTALDFVGSKTLRFRVSIQGGVIKHEVQAIVPHDVVAQIKARKNRQ